MSDYKAKTIREIILDINERRMFLPSIQRNFVWSNEQITNLMDSIMREYPIGTFLFWEIDKQTLNKEKYTLYEFLKNYHERDTYLNSKAPAPYCPAVGEDDKSCVTAVLDGQQRLTSLYLALQGTIARKEPRARTDNDNSYKEKELYFNLFSDDMINEGDDDSVVYEFQFLDKSEIRNNNEKFWYKVKDILPHKQGDIFKIVNGITRNMDLSDDKISLIGDNLAKLQAQLVENKIINFFNAKADHEHNKFTTLDEVTDIFVRINSGGTKLNKSDLLFSRIVSVWNDAREEIQNVVKILNASNVYKFNNDFIIKACLMNIGCSSKLKVETLTVLNINRIKDSWGKIREAIEFVREFLFKNGFRDENIASYNAILPMILYCYKVGVNNVNSTSKRAMKSYFVVAQVENLFGKGSNSVLDRLQKNIEKLGNNAIFPNVRELGFNKKFDRAMIDEWFEYEKGINTFIILSLLYHECRFDSRIFHQDHMHPYSLFDKDAVIDSIHNVIDRDGNRLCSLDEKKQFLKHQRNQLANLQLLEGPDNVSKNAKPLEDWLNKDDNRCHTKFLPDSENGTYPIEEFENFMRLRKEKMANALCEILEIKQSVDNDVDERCIRKRRQKTRFIDLDINVGDIITYCMNDKVVAQVTDDNKVLFEGKRYSLSGLTKVLLNNNQAVNGFKYWKYNGQLLCDIRDELELYDEM